MTIQGADPVRDAEARARDRHGADLDHPRSGGRRRPRRPHLRDVRRPHRRAGHASTTCSTRPLHPYTQGLLDSVPTRNARGARLRADPRHDAVAARPAARLRVSRALRARDRRACASTPAMRASPTAPARQCAAFHPLRSPLHEPAAAAAASMRAPADAADRAARRVASASSRRSTSRRGSATCSAPSVREEVVHAVDRVDLAITPRRGGRPGRRIGLRQVDARAPGRRPAAADARASASGAARRSPAAPARARAAAARDADDLPGPLRLAQPAHARRRHRRRGAGRARLVAPRRAAGLRRRRMLDASASIRR